MHTSTGTTFQSCLDLPQIYIFNLRIISAQHLILGWACVCFFLSLPNVLSMGEHRKAYISSRIQATSFIFRSTRWRYCRQSLLWSSTLHAQLLPGDLILHYECRRIMIWNPTSFSKPVHKYIPPCSAAGHSPDSKKKPSFNRKKDLVCIITHHSARPAQADSTSGSAVWHKMADYRVKKVMFTQLCSVWISVDLCNSVQQRMLQQWSGPTAAIEHSIGAFHCGENVRKYTITLPLKISLHTFGQTHTIVVSFLKIQLKM